MNPHSAGDAEPARPISATSPPGLDARNIQRLITAISYASRQWSEGKRALMTAHRPALGETCVPSENQPGMMAPAEPGVMPPGGVIRFNVAESGRTRRSAVWLAVTAKSTDDVYVATKLAGRFIKVSLHESGSWQHGFISDDKAQGFRSPGQPRHFTIWQRPDEIIPGWTRAVRIIIPDAALQTRPSPGTLKKPVADLLAIPGGDTSIVEIWLESAVNLTPPPLRGSQLAGRLRQPGGGTVWVVGQRMTLPWDPYQRFSQMVTAAHSEATRLNPNWAGDPPLSICLHNPDSRNRELILCELAVTALIRRMVKMLNAVSGGLDFSFVPEAERTWAQWEEAAGLASAIADQALAVIAAGMTPQQAADWLLHTDTSHVLGHGGSLRRCHRTDPPDYLDTERPLTVTIRADKHQGRGGRRRRCR